jgi:glycosyltransferase involved in cell wall biosynthesis
MKIAVDISSVNPLRTGIGIYTLELTRELVKHTEHDFTLMFNSYRQPVPAITNYQAPNVTMRARRIPGPFLLRAWQRVNWPAVESLTGPFDVFHSPATYVPAQRHGARVTTVHDLSFLDPNTIGEPLGGQYLKWIVENRLRHMDAILTINSQTRDELRDILIKQLGSDSDLPHLILSPLGIHQKFFQPTPPEEIMRVRRSLGIPRRYMLHVGTLEPRKNLPTLVRALAHAIEADSSFPSLVLVGGKGWGDQPDAELVEMLTRAGRLYQVGYIDQDDLPALYHGADLLVAPSILEGFGLPTAEAMAGGTPVVCSNTCGVLEFVGPDAALTFDPMDEATLLKHILMLSRDRHLCREFAERGRRAAEKLSWAACANVTIGAYHAAYERALNRRPKEMSR